MNKHYLQFAKLCISSNINKLRQLLILKLAQYRNNRVRFVRLLNFWRIFRTFENKTKQRIHPSTIASQIQQMTGWSWSLCLKIACVGA